MRKRTVRTARERLANAATTRYTPLPRTPRERRPGWFFTVHVALNHGNHFAASELWGWSVSRRRMPAKSVGIWHFRSMSARASAARIVYEF